MKSIDVLCEKALAPRFRRALRKDGGASIAVPFWGRGAIKLLGLEGGQDLQIICNLEHPGCNPDVIEELRALKIKVWKNPHLHAKIYLTEHLAIVGSSNASSNGLAVEGKPALGWLEANVAGTAPSFVGDVRTRFQEIMDDLRTTPVKPADIRRAKERRAKLPPSLFALGDKQPLFEAARAHPEAFASVFVAICDEGLDDEAVPLLSAAGADLAARTKQAVSDRLDGYQFAEMPRGAWLINVFCAKGNAPIYNGTSQVFGDPIKVFRGRKRLIDLSLTLQGPMLLGEVAFTLNKSERAALLAAAPALLKAAGDKLLPLARAVKIIDRNAAT